MRKEAWEDLSLRKSTNTTKSARLPRQRGKLSRGQLRHCNGHWSPRQVYIGATGSCTLGHGHEVVPNLRQHRRSASRAGRTSGCPRTSRLSVRLSRDNSQPEHQAGGQIRTECSNMRQDFSCWCSAHRSPACPGVRNMTAAECA